MLKACPYCGRVHDRKYICPKKPKPHKSQTQITAFRSGIHWQRVRRAILIRDRYLCRLCLSEGIYTSGDLEVHHITPLSEDFSKRCDPFNLITLCPVHHEKAEHGHIPADKLREMIPSNIPPCDGTE